GFYQVDLSTGKKSLFLSYARIFEALPDKDELDGGTFYGFHVKFNPQHTRVALVVRVVMPNARLKNMVVTCRVDAGDIRLAVPHVSYGHHLNWHPDGVRILRYARDGQRTMRFLHVNYDGTDEQVVVPTVIG